LVYWGLGRGGVSPFDWLRINSTFNTNFPGPKLDQGLCGRLYPLNWSTRG
jgi:hypothetical protein